MNRNIMNRFYSILRNLTFLLFFMAFLGIVGQDNLQAQKRGGNQDVKLAQEYFRKGEYEKATPLFKKLYEENGTNSYYYKNYLKCLVSLKDFEEAQKLVKKYGKKRKNDPSILVDLGYVYKQMGNDKEAEEQFEKAVSQLGKEKNSIRLVANAFTTMEEYDYAVKVFERGQEIMKSPTIFAYDRALAYKRVGNYDKMIGAYLDYLVEQPTKEQTVKNEFQKIIKIEKYRDMLESQLYKGIQESPSQLAYPQMLVWLFIQEKDYESAFIQVKALDKRLNEDGRRVFDLAQTATLENQFNAATQAYEYVIEKGPISPLYEPAKMALVGAKMKRLQYDKNYTETDLTDLEADYLSILDEFGRNPNSVRTMRSLGHLYAFYLHDIDRAIEVMEAIVQMPAADRHLKAKSKLDLGDFYIINEDIWESTLYYSQVDKEFKEDILGEEARFRNAKLSYYTGDFEWAQSQLSILKASTSELISNDALDLSVFILDNMGLDTSAAAMNMFAQADLMIFQNKTEEAEAMMTALEAEFPGHALADDILYRRGTIAYKKRNYEKAAEYWEKVLADFSTDILADNALFHLADLYETYLNQPTKAQQYYQMIVVDFPGSLYTVEARKRFRKLRGDTIN